MARRARTRRIRISDLSKVVNEVLTEYSKGLVDAYNKLAKQKGSGENSRRFAENQPETDRQICEGLDVQEN